MGDTPAWNARARFDPVGWAWTHPPAKSEIPRTLPTAADLYVQSSENGIALPIVYGTDRVAANVLEMLPPLQIPSTAAGNSPAYVQQFVLGICEGMILGTGRVWREKEKFTSVADMIGFGPEYQVMFGANNQTRNAFYTEAYNYENTACLLVKGLLPGVDNSLPQISIETYGPLSPSTLGGDVSPVDIAIDLLTHPRRGAGWSTSKIDSVSTGNGTASWRTYCAANGIQISWTISSQSTVLELLSQLLVLTNTDAVWSGGQLKFVPRSDKQVGAYVPNQVPLYDLGPDDFLSVPTISRVSPTDTFNSIPVQYRDRARDYGTNVVDDADMADVDRRGLVRSSTVALPFVMPEQAAVMLSRTLAQRSIHVRNTYTLEVGWKYLLTEPADILTVTDPVMGLEREPVRVVAWEESIDNKGESRITLTCEDYPIGVAAAAQYQQQPGDGFRPTGIRSPINGLILGGIGLDGFTAGGQGANLLYSADFSTSIPGSIIWAVGYVGVNMSAYTSVGIAGVELVSADWSLGGNANASNSDHMNTLAVHEAGIAGNPGAYVAVTSNPTTVEEGRRYCYSVYTGAHRCKVTLMVTYFDGYNSAIGAVSYFPDSAATNDQEAAGGRLLSGYKRIYAIDTVPVGVATVRLQLTKYDTVAGQTDSWMFACRCAIEKVGDNATAPGPWVAP